MTEVETMTEVEKPVEPLWVPTLRNLLAAYVPLVPFVRQIILADGWFFIAFPVWLPMALLGSWGWLLSYLLLPLYLSLCVYLAAHQQRKTWPIPVIPATVAVFSTIQGLIGLVVFRSTV